MSPADIARHMRQFDLALAASRAAAAQRQITRQSWQQSCAVGHARFCSAMHGTGAQVIACGGAVKACVHDRTVPA